MTWNQVRELQRACIISFFRLLDVRQCAEAEQNNRRRLTRFCNEAWQLGSSDDDIQ